MQSRTSPRETNSETRALLLSEISFIDSPEFSACTEAQISRDAPALFQDDLSDSASRGSSVENPGDRRFSDPLLTPEGERFLFRKMNFLKRRANTLRAKLSPRQPARKQVQEIRRLLAAAEEVRNQLTRSNLRLVAGIAHRFASNRVDYEDLLAEGSLILLKAIDKFDYTRGFRFSTYATHAVQRHFVRVVQRAHKQRLRESQAAEDRWGVDLVSPETEPRLNPRAADELIRHFDQCLDERERVILQERFGLKSSTSCDTLKEVAEKVGLSKERVRQLQLRAIEKLQDLAQRLNLRPEWCLG